MLETNGRTQRLPRRGAHHWTKAWVPLSLPLDRFPEKFLASRSRVLPAASLAHLQSRPTQISSFSTLRPYLLNGTFAGGVTASPVLRSYCDRWSGHVSLS